MVHFKIRELVEDWDNIELEYDAKPKEIIKSDDHDELVDRFWDAILHPELEQEEEIDEDDMPF